MSGTESTGRGAHRAEEVPINGTSPSVSQDGASRSPAEIEAEIEQQREELAETLDALTAKLDVKAQAQAKAEQVKVSARHTVADARDRATTDTGKPRPELLAGVALAVAGVVALAWWRRRR